MNADNIEIKVSFKSDTSLDDFMIAHKFEAKESISSEYEYKVFVLLKNDKTYDDLLNFKQKDIEINISHIKDGKTKNKKFFGILSAMRNKGFLKFNSLGNEEIKAYAYEFDVRPKAILQGLELKTREFKDKDFDYIVKALFVEQNISPSLRDKEYFNNTHKIIYQQQQESNLSYVKKLLRLYGLNYYYKENSIELSTGLSFLGKTINSNEILGLNSLSLTDSFLEIKDDRRYALQYVADNNFEKDINDFFTKNINKMIRTKSKIYANCADIELDLTSIVKFSKENFSQDIEARVCAFNLFVSKKISEDNVLGIDNTNEINIDFVAFKKEDVNYYGYIDSANDEALNTVRNVNAKNFNPSPALNTVRSVNTKNFNPSLALNTELKTAALNNTELNASSFIQKAYVSNVSNTNNKTYNTFEAKLLDGTSTTITVYITSAIGGLTSTFFRRPKVNDVVLVMKAGSEWFLHSYLLEEKESILDRSKQASIFKESTNQENELLDDLLDQLFLSYEYKIDKTANNFKRQGSYIGIGKNYDFNTTLRYWERRAMKERKQSMYDDILGLSDSLGYQSKFNINEDENTKAFNPSYQIVLDTAGSINLDADEHIFAHSGKDMYLAANDLFVTTENTIEIKSPKSIVFRVGRNSIEITEAGIHLNALHHSSSVFNSSLSIEPVDGVSIEGPDISARADFNLDLNGNGSILYLGCAYAKLHSHNVRFTSSSSLVQCSESLLRAFDLGLKINDIKDGHTQRSDPYYDDVFKLKYFKSIAHKIHKMIDEGADTEGVIDILNYIFMLELQVNSIVLKIMKMKSSKVDKLETALACSMIIQQSVIVLTSIGYMVAKAIKKEPISAFKKTSMYLNGANTELDTGFLEIKYVGSDETLGVKFTEKRALNETILKSCLKTAHNVVDWFFDIAHAIKEKKGG